jgi:hypothetical protein
MLNETPEQRKARHAGYVQKWRLANPEKHKLARRRAYLNRKIKAFRVIGEVKCKNCGCDVLEFLEFNHINGGGCKEWRENKGRQMADLLLTKGRKPEGLEILRRVCNALDFLGRKNKQEVNRYKIIWKNKSLETKKEE